MSFDVITIWRSRAQLLTPSKCIGSWFRWNVWLAVCRNLKRGFSTSMLKPPPPGAPTANTFTHMAFQLSYLQSKYLKAIIYESCQIHSGVWELDYGWSCYDGQPSSFRKPYSYSRLIVAIQPFLLITTSSFLLHTNRRYLTVNSRYIDISFLHRWVTSSIKIGNMQLPVPAYLRIYVKDRRAKI